MALNNCELDGWIKVDEGEAKSNLSCSFEDIHTDTNTQKYTIQNSLTFSASFFLFYISHASKPVPFFLLFLCVEII